jgi:hypothetical protein
MNIRTIAGVAARIARPFGGAQAPFMGTPLPEALEIMGRKVHGIEDVRLALSHDFEFADVNRHLTVVPYTRGELEWAVKNSVVLTIMSRSIQRLLSLSQGAIGFPEEVRRGCESQLRKYPTRAAWFLVMRVSTEHGECQALKGQPEHMKERSFIPPLNLAISTAILDCRIHGRRPPMNSGPRLTGTTYESRGRLERRYVLLEGGSVGTYPIQVVTSASPGHPALVAWKPHEIRRA